ncbi:MAG: hypothetical protein U0271_42055 [Polyangiaceae bacterium]
MNKPAELDQTISQMFEAERRVRKLHNELADSDEGPLLDAVSRAIEAALKESDENEASLRLERLAVLLGEREGARVVDLLIDVLASEFPDARAAAGEQLEGLAFDRFKEVAKGVERAVKRLPDGSPALPELPYIVAQVPEPGVSKLLKLFLEHRDPDAVAAAIEASVEIGDVSQVDALERLSKDGRTVEVTDEEDESATVTIGELALEAMDVLSQDEELDDEEDEEDEEPPPPPKPQGKPANAKSPAKKG